MSKNHSSRAAFVFLALTPFCGLAPCVSQDPPASTLAEVRTGLWPIHLERTVFRKDTTYALLFRDQHVSNGMVMDTLEFSNKVQLKYFEQALVALKNGHHGDIAAFKDYSISRAEVRFDGVWYVLKLKWGVTNFQQPEADVLIQTIHGQ